MINATSQRCENGDPCSSPPNEQVQWVATSDSSNVMFVVACLLFAMAFLVLFIRDILDFYLPYISPDVTVA